MAGARATTTALATVLLAALGGCGGSPTAPPPSELGHPPAVCSTMAVNAGMTAEMEPGGDCIGCHSKGGAPALLVGGTVMADLHDDTNCAGVEGITVRVTGADGKMLEMVTGVTGNFYALADADAGTLALPLHAQVIRGDKMLMMLTAQADPNCMSCHTAKGAKLALGRILAPAP